MAYAPSNRAWWLTDIAIFAIALLILVALIPRPVVYPVTPAFSHSPSAGVTQPRLKPVPPPFGDRRRCEKDSTTCKD